MMKMTMMLMNDDGIIESLFKSLTLPSQASQLLRYGVLTLSLLD